MQQVTAYFNKQIAQLRMVVAQLNPATIAIRPRDLYGYLQVTREFEEQVADLNFIQDKIMLKRIIIHPGLMSRVH